MSEYKLPAVVDLSFFVVDAVPIIQEIFKDRTARTLWLGIKYQHIVSNYFNQDCLDAAKAIQHKGFPIDGWWLNGLLRNFDMIGSEELLGEFLAPYINGKKHLGWKERRLNVPTEH